MKAYWTGRREKTIVEGFGPYRLNIRYFANGNKAQVTMIDLGDLKSPFEWSTSMTDDQANAALEIFKATGFFELVF